MVALLNHIDALLLVDLPVYSTTKERKKEKASVTSKPWNGRENFDDIDRLVKWPFQDPGSDSSRHWIDLKMGIASLLLPHQYNCLINTNAESLRKLCV